LTPLKFIYLGSILKDYGVGDTRPFGELMNYFFS